MRADHNATDSTCECIQNSAYNETLNTCECVEGYGYNLASDTCELCEDTNCVDCSDNSTECEVCDYSYYLNSTNQCESCPSPCGNCSSESICLDCVLRADHNATDSTCECIQNSTYHETTNTCECTAGYGYNSTNDTCEVCEDPNCADCSSNLTECEVCKYSYYLNSTNQCESCPSPCGNCTSESNCSDCVLGADYNATNSSCECIQNSTYHETTNTCECVKGHGYNLANDTCELCEDTNCIDCSDNSTECEVCDYSYYLNSSYQCESCPSPCGNCSSESNCSDCVLRADHNATDSTCECIQNSTYHETTNTCECTAGYGYNSTNDTCEVCEDPNCADCSSNLTECEVCKYSYYLNSTNQCESCPSPCGNCTSESNCSDCVLGADYNATNSSCDCANNSAYHETSNTCECVAGYGYDSINDTCELCEDSNCLLCQSNYSICDECNSTYYLKDSSICVDCPGPCNKCLNETACLDCVFAADYNQTSMECSCINNSDYNSNDNECQCTSGYGHDGNSSCIECSQLNCLDCPNNYSDCELCNNSYFLNDTFDCVECPDLCANCSSLNNCSECVQSAYLNENLTCVCIGNSTFNQTTDICECNAGFGYNSNMSNCAECNKSNCLVCENDYLTCEVCEDTYYLNNLNVCTDCVGPCKNCSSENECLDCVPKADFNGTDNTCTCIDHSEYSNDTDACECKEGYGYNDINKTCDPCSDSNCLECFNNYTECEVCDFTYYFNDTLGCSKCPEQCANCTNSTFCLDCVDAADYEEVSGTCTCTNNSEYKNTTDSCECIPGYGFDLNQTCQSCDTDSCIECFDNYTVCETCDYGYFLNDSGVCLKCRSPCGNCSSYDVCLDCVDLAAYNSTGFDCNCINQSDYNNETDSCECVSGYGFNSIDGICEVCSDDNCLECKSNYSICDTCDFTYYLNESDSCSPCQSPCGNCSNISTCIDCIYLAELGEDNATCSCVNHSEYNSTSSSCECLSGYQADPETETCQKCSQESCLLCTSNYSICELCDSTYYLNQTGECLKCSLPCLNCSSDSECIDCVVRATLNQNDSTCNCINNSDYSNITESCECNDEYGYDSINETCVPCNTSSCALCSEDYSNCTECKSEYYLSENNCLECVGQCKTCKNETFCLSCFENSNYDNETGTCECIERFIFNNETNVCACVNNSAYENDTNTCECLPGYGIDSDNSSCVPCNESSCLRCSNNYSICEECDDKYYLGDNGMCLDCPEPCANCSNSSYCYSCVDKANLLENSTCSCIDNADYNISSGACECFAGEGPECLICSNLSYYNSTEENCSCILNSYLNDSYSLFVCSCNDSYGYDSANHICSPCNDSNCSDCESDYMICEECPSGYFLDSNSTCQECPKTCSECLNATHCTECIEKAEYDEVNKNCSCIQNSIFNSSSDACECFAGEGPNCTACPNRTYYNTGSDECECVTNSRNESNSSELQCVCEDGYGYESENNTCESCDSLNCALCTDDYKNCTQCDLGYYLGEDNTCYDCPNACSNCSDSLTCNECSDLTTKDQNGNCSCINYTNYNESTKTCECIDGLGYNNDTNSCDLCEDANCVDCSGNYSICETCNESYYVNDTFFCSECPETCSTCMNSSWCDVCVTRAEIDPDTSVCACINRSQYNSTTGACECYEGYGESCVLCSNRSYWDSNNSSCLCINNSSPKANNSSECTCDLGFGYNSVTGTCDPCADLNCSKCPSDYQICEACDSTFFLNETSQCEDCPGPCNTCTNATTCLDCVYRAEFNEISSNCTCIENSAYNSTTDQCECTTGQGSICQLCPNHTFYNETTNECQCNENSSNSSGSCICNSGFGYNQYNDTCQLCALSNCLQCSGDYNECEVCDSTYFVNETNGCSKCVAPCLKCSNETTCIDCIYGADYNSTKESCTCTANSNLNSTLGSCVCDKKFGFNSTEDCRACADSNCNECYSNHSRCEVCKDSYYLETGFTCSKCLSPCKTCQVTNSTCRSCITDATLNTTTNQCKCNGNLTYNATSESCGCSSSQTRADDFCYNCRSYLIADDLISFNYSTSFDSLFIKFSAQLSSISSCSDVSYNSSYFGKSAKCALEGKNTIKVTLGSNWRPLLSLHLNYEKLLVVNSSRCIQLPTKSLVVEANLTGLVFFSGGSIEGVDEVFTQCNSLKTSNFELINFNDLTKAGVTYSWSVSSTSTEADDKLNPDLESTDSHKAQLDLEKYEDAEGYIILTVNITNGFELTYQVSLNITLTLDSKLSVGIDGDSVVYVNSDSNLKFAAKINDKCGKRSGKVEFTWTYSGTAREPEYKVSGINLIIKKNSLYANQNYEFSVTASFGDIKSNTAKLTIIVIKRGLVIDLDAPMLISTSGEALFDGSNSYDPNLYLEEPEKTYTWTCEKTDSDPCSQTLIDLFEAEKRNQLRVPGDEFSDYESVTVNFKFDSGNLTANNSIVVKISNDEYSVNIQFSTNRVSVSSFNVIAGKSNAPQQGLVRYSWYIENVEASKYIAYQLFLVTFPNAFDYGSVYKLRLDIAIGEKIYEVAGLLVSNQKPECNNYAVTPTSGRLFVDVFYLSATCSDEEQDYPLFAVASFELKSKPKSRSDIKVTNNFRNCGSRMPSGQIYIHLSVCDTMYDCDSHRFEVDVTIGRRLADTDYQSAYEQAIQDDPNSVAGLCSILASSIELDNEFWNLILDDLEVYLNDLDSYTTVEVNSAASCLYWLHNETHLPNLAYDDFIRSYAVIQELFTKYSDNNNNNGTVAFDESTLQIFMEISESFYAISQSLVLNDSLFYEIFELGKDIQATSWLKYSYGKSSGVEYSYQSDSFISYKKIVNYFNDTQRLVDLTEAGSNHTQVDLADSIEDNKTQVGVMVTSFSDVGNFTKFGEAVEVKLTTEGYIVNDSFVAETDSTLTLSNPLEITIKTSIPIDNSTYTCGYWTSNGSFFTDSCTIMSTTENTAKIQVTHFGLYGMKKTEFILLDSSCEVNHAPIIIMAVVGFIMMILIPLMIMLDSNYEIESLENSNSDHGISKTIEYSPRSPASLTERPLVSLSDMSIPDVEEISESIIENPNAADYTIEFKLRSLDEVDQKVEKVKKSWFSRLIEGHLLFGLYVHRPVFLRAFRVITLFATLILQLFLEGIFLFYAYGTDNSEDVENDETATQTLFDDYKGDYFGYCIVAIAIAIPFELLLIVLFSKSWNKAVLRTVAIVLVVVVVGGSIAGIIILTLDFCFKWSGYWAISFLWSVLIEIFFLQVLYMFVRFPIKTDEK